MLRTLLVGSALIMRLTYTVAIYLAMAYSLYTIGKRNHVRGAWLAFVPILQYYIIGSLCEEYIIARRRIRFLQWFIMIPALLQIYLGFFSNFFFIPVRLVINFLMALFLHKFFYLFVPNRATLYAAFSMFGQAPLVVFLYFIKDKPMAMSAGAYPYPFETRY